jgi:alginate O-acetyltransferase complex protein AlgI
MLFNSYIFIFGYLPVTLAGFFLLGRNSHRLAALWLTAASLFFYGWWNPVFVVLVMASITVNYAFGYAIGHARLTSEAQAKTVLTVAVVANLGLLAYFKYANFFIANVSQLTGVELSAVNIVLPLGISFFTFTQIAFLVDVYRGIAREYNFIHYVLFVTYFPHLIAGPVLHHKQMMPQFGHAVTYRINLENINVGLTIFVIGLTKKLLIADPLALCANPVFDAVAHGGEPKLFESWVGAIAYALQIYFDFSGYSDMAIGLSRMFNIRLPLNFNSPYKAPNIIEFWRCWHMTLSTFLRDYLYVPLGGNRKGELQRYINIIVTMLLGGMWHGAGWTFVIWGGLHGLYLVINHGWRRLISNATKYDRGGRSVSITLTFIAVVIAWVPFRAADLETVFRLWAGMFGFNGISLPISLSGATPAWLSHVAAFDGVVTVSVLSVKRILITLPVAFAIIWTLPNTQQWLSHNNPAWDPTVPSSGQVWSPNSLNAIALGGILGICILSLNKVSEFLYFQF